MPCPEAVRTGHPRPLADAMWPAGLREGQGVTGHLPISKERGTGLESWSRMRHPLPEIHADTPLTPPRQLLAELTLLPKREAEPPSSSHKDRILLSGNGTGHRTSSKQTGPH